jgi:hypothetical protein
LYKGKAGGTETIQVGDLFRVQTLRVTVRDSAGDIVETGTAVRDKKYFLYCCKRDHPRGQVLTIDAVADSRAGHQVFVSERVSVPQ